MASIASRKITRTNIIRDPQASDCYARGAQHGPRLDALGGIINVIPTLHYEHGEREPRIVSARNRRGWGGRVGTSVAPSPIGRAAVRPMTRNSIHREAHTRTPLSPTTTRDTSLSRLVASAACEKGSFSKIFLLGWGSSA